MRPRRALCLPPGWSAPTYFARSQAEVKRPFAQGARGVATESAKLPRAVVISTAGRAPGAPRRQPQVVARSSRAMHTWSGGHVGRSSEQLCRHTPPLLLLEGRESKPTQQVEPVA